MSPNGIKAACRVFSSTSSARPPKIQIKNHSHEKDRKKIHTMLKTIRELRLTKIQQPAIRMHCKIVFNFALRHDFPLKQDNPLLAYAS